jgi:periodic tryptophan protein 1
VNDSDQQKKLVKKFGSKNASAQKLAENTHTDAVMCLSLNPFQREYLLSGSADNTVRVWDLDELACKATYTLHTDKVQAVRWNKVNESTFLSGGYDGLLNLCDVRDAKGSLQH